MTRETGRTPPGSMGPTLGSARSPGPGSPPAPPSRPAFPALGALSASAVAVPGRSWGARGRLAGLGGAAPPGGWPSGARRHLPSSTCSAPPLLAGLNPHKAVIRVAERAPEACRRT